MKQRPTSTEETLRKEKNWALRISGGSFFLSLLIYLIMHLVAVSQTSPNLVAFTPLPWVLPLGVLCYQGFKVKAFGDLSFHGIPAQLLTALIDLANVGVAVASLREVESFRSAWKVLSILSLVTYSGYICHSIVKEVHPSLLDLVHRSFRTFGLLFRIQITCYAFLFDLTTGGPSLPSVACHIPILIVIVAWLFGAGVVVRWMQAKKYSERLALYIWIGLLTISMALCLAFYIACLNEYLNPSVGLLYGLLSLLSCCLSGVSIYFLFKHLDKIAAMMSPRVSKESEMNGLEIKEEVSLKDKQKHRTEEELGKAEKPITNSKKDQKVTVNLQSDSLRQEDRQDDGMKASGDREPRFQVDRPKRESKFTDKVKYVMRMSPNNQCSPMSREEEDLPADGLETEFVFLAQNNRFHKLKLGHLKSLIEFEKQIGVTLPHSQGIPFDLSSPKHEIGDPRTKIMIGTEPEPISRSQGYRMLEILTQEFRRGKKSISHPQLCSKCCKRTADTVIFPCGHKPYCFHCIQLHFQESIECPKCKQEFDNLVTIDAKREFKGIHEVKESYTINHSG